MNKLVCGEQGIKGFPTIKVSKHPYKLYPRDFNDSQSFARGGKGVPHDYQGERKAKPIADWAGTEVPNKIESVGKPAELTKWMKKVCTRENLY